MSSPKRKTSSSPSCEGKVTGVTAKNYYDKAKAFMRYMEAEGDSTRFGVDIDPQTTPDKWGAWVDYFEDKRKYGSIAFMKVRAAEYRYWSAHRKSEQCCYQVPADLPSDFDAEREYYRDKLAGEAFMDKQAEPPMPELSAAQKAAIVQKIRAAARRGAQ